MVITTTQEGGSDTVRQLPQSLKQQRLFLSMGNYYCETGSAKCYGHQEQREAVKYYLWTKCHLQVDWLHIMQWIPKARGKLECTTYGQSAICNAKQKVMRAAAPKVREIPQNEFHNSDTVIAT